MTSEIDQLYKICSLLGAPDWRIFPEATNLSRLIDVTYSEMMLADLSEIIPNASLEAIDSIKQLCSWDPLKRPTADQCLEHPFFHETEYQRRLEGTTMSILNFSRRKSPFHHEALHMTSKLDRRFSALIEVQECGSNVTEEQSEAMLIPLEYFLMSYGFYRPSEISASLRSPLSSTSISPELFFTRKYGLEVEAN